MEQNKEEIYILKEKDFILTSDKNIEYKIKLSIDNNDLFCITAISSKTIPLKKYFLSSTLNDLIKNRFFKIFLNIEEIFRELENKIEKSTIYEETNILYLDIPIGLTIINDIILKINETEESKDDMIEHLKFELNEKNNIINQKDNKIKELENKLKEKEINGIYINNKNEGYNEELKINMNYENIIEIELETNQNNKEIKIINDNLFKRDKTVLFINKDKKDFSNFFNFDKIGKYKILILNNNKLEKLSEIFKECKELKTINFLKFNTTNIKDMNSMFYGCESLTSIDISKLSTKNVQYMNSMFYGCEYLQSINVSNLNTKEVENMSFMFSECSSLTSIDISSFNTENVKNMNGIFNGCSSLTSIDISNFNTKNVQYMNSMFYGCESLKSIDVSKFDTKKVTNMNYMFCDCSSLKSIDISNFELDNVKQIENLFDGCFNLNRIYVSKFNKEKFAYIMDDSKLKLK